jgi:hypothetical protein
MPAVNLDPTIVTVVIELDPNRALAARQVFPCTWMLSLSTLAATAVSAV